MLLLKLVNVLKYRCLNCHKLQEKIQQKEGEIDALSKELKDKTPSCKSLLKNYQSVKFYMGLPSKAVFNLVFEHTEPTVKTGGELRTLSLSLKQHPQKREVDKGKYLKKMKCC